MFIKVGLKEINVRNVLWFDDSGDRLVVAVGSSLRNGSKKRIRLHGVYRDSFLKDPSVKKYFFMVDPLRGINFDAVEIVEIFKKQVDEKPVLHAKLIFNDKNRLILKDRLAKKFNLEFNRIRKLEDA